MDERNDLIQLLSLRVFVRQEPVKLYDMHRWYFHRYCLAKDNIVAASEHSFGDFFSGTSMRSALDFPLVPNQFCKAPCRLSSVCWVTWSFLFFVHSSWPHTAAPQINFLLELGESNCAIIEAPSRRLEPILFYPLGMVILEAASD